MINVTRRPDAEEGLFSFRRDVSWPQDLVNRRRFPLFRLLSHDAVIADRSRARARAHVSL